MKSIRLLPVVVFASLALLAFKTIGLVTSGSYVLTGTSSAVAAGGGAAEPAPGETLTIPPEPTLEDKAPTLSDGAPTMPLAAPAAAGGHGEGAPAPATEGEHGAELVAAEAPPAVDAVATGAPDMTAEAPAAQPEGQQIGETERTILNRLAERRSELNGIEGELATRQQLVEAAERKLAEGGLWHGGQPMMAWCCGNARVEPRGNAILITKQASGSAKIDPLMALFNAVTLLALNPEAQGGMGDYLDNGFFGLIG